VEDLNKLSKTNVAMAQAMKRLATAYSEKESQCLYLKSSNDALNLELGSANQQLTSASRGHVQDAEKLLSKVTKLKETMQKMEEDKLAASLERAALNEKAANFKAENDRMMSAKTEADKRIEVSTDFFINLFRKS
jgi:hypothetical protein